MAIIPRTQRARADMDALEVCNKHALMLLEDSAQASVKYRGRAGTLDAVA